MSLKNFKVFHCDRKEITEFIETNHYSHSINGCITDYCFKLVDENNVMVGAAFFCKMAMANQFKKFSDKEEDVTELRRLCCVDDTPKNTESYFIAKIIS